MTIAMLPRKLLGEDDVVGWRVAATLAAVMLGAFGTWITGVGQEVRKGDIDSDRARIAKVEQEHQAFRVEFAEYKTLLTTIVNQQVQLSGKVDRLIERSNP